MRQEQDKFPLGFMVKCPQKPTHKNLLPMKYFPWKQTEILRKKNQQQQEKHKLGNLPKLKQGSSYQQKHKFEKKDKQRSIYQICTDRESQKERGDEGLLLLPRETKKGNIKGGED